MLNKTAILIYSGLYCNSFERKIYETMNITDELLLNSYYKAIELKLDNNFIGLLKIEIDKRNLDLTINIQF